VPLIHEEQTGKAPERVGLNHPSLAPYGAYATRGGEPVLISIQNEREWARLCGQVLSNPELATDQRFDTNEKRVANRDALNIEIDKVFSKFDREELIVELRHANIAFGSLNSVRGLSEHPQLRRAAIDLPGGLQLNLPAPPAKAPGEVFRPGAVPALGEHSEKLRAEFARGTAPKVEGGAE
jgi:itaconate CoA-transferase